MSWSLSFFSVLYVFIAVRDASRQLGSFSSLMPARSLCSTKLALSFTASSSILWPSSQGHGTTQRHRSQSCSSIP